MSDLKICLAASGGGHIRQILDLEPFWSMYSSYFFVTEDTALGESIASEHPTEFVNHVALGQAKLGAPLKMLICATKNLFKSLWIVLSHRPDLVITTGAGSVYFVVLFARLLGSRIVLIDSFARFQGPSAFARIAGPIAHIRIAQSEVAGRKWNDAKVFDPLRILGSRTKQKDNLLFATVGATLPFERLVNLVQAARKAGFISEAVILQTGRGGLIPDGIETHETLPFDQVKDILKRADIVVCHGGTGSLITALREGCRVIAVPRAFERGEHYDNHQTEITQAFEQRGLIAVANTEDEFAEALRSTRLRDPVMATTDPSELIDFLKSYANGMSARKHLLPTV